MSGKIRYVLGILVLLFVVGEILFLIFLNHKNTVPNTDKISQNSPSSAPSQTQNNIAGLFYTTPGFYVATIDNRSFMLLGQINTITQNSNGDITADISFATNKGQGPLVNKQFLLFTKSQFISNIFLRKTKSFTLSIPTTDQKLFTLDPQKDQTTTMDTLHKYEKQKAILVFDTVIYPLGTQKIVQASGDILNKLIACNKSFLDALNNNSSIPSCSPFIAQITVYDTNF